MDQAAYLEGVAALYTGEIWGEGFASRWLAQATDAHQQYILSLVLQLESEAKVRLRPLLARHGLSLVEDEAQRAAGAAAVDAYVARPWPDAMRALADLARPYLERYRALLQAAPPADVAAVGYMVRHEEALVRLGEREATGDGLADAELLPMLAHAPARPEPKESLARARP